MGVVLLKIEELEINPDTMKLEIDIMEVPKNCVIVISEGRAKLRELPPFGEYKIITHQGKVKRMRKEEGEEF
ncbi:XtrA/YqaO family protein [Caldibacillus thermoamylovorans]|uniref:XtrA/YqaO family protein n=1 Tax=Caldibacillus thermoamylovorans TaxID=35841 RepID=UPI003AF32CA0